MFARRNLARRRAFRHAKYVCVTTTHRTSRKWSLRDSTLRDVVMRRAKLFCATKDLVRDKLSVIFDLDDISPEVKAYLDETLATRYKHWKNYLHTHFKLWDTPEIARLSGCPSELKDWPEDWEWLCKHFTNPKFVKKSVAGKIARESKTLLHHSGSKPFSYRLEARRQEGSKFPEIDMFEDVYVRPGDANSEHLHALMVEKRTAVIFHFVCKFLVYGMSGIGKTTIAKHVYNSNFRSFEGSSLIENIRETTYLPNGLVQIQKQLLSNILNGREVKIHRVSEGLRKIERAISSRRVLLILDEVDHMDQLDAVLKMKDRLYSGSKILITTRRERLQKAHQVTKVHKVGTLYYDESLELFNWHAFRQYHPLRCYIEYSENVVHYCNGLPLALIVLGPSLSWESIDAWESALEKLKVIPNGEIMNKLRISYDSLQDDHDRKLFLHIHVF
ncbi:hypothetical protein ACFX2C_040348 [Malus domestica]